ncbi:MAG: hypothetical protein KC620_04420 [Myxococcales bacterium]|nr:hypothetical protein [Myxococcales bacterium]
MLAAPAPEMAPPALPDGPAELEAEDDLTGRFTIEGTLQNPLGGAIEVHFIGVATQAGALTEGTATLALELRDPSTPDTAGPGFPAPVPIDGEGAFIGTVPDMVVPTHFSDLLRAPANATIALDGRVQSVDCFAGRVDLALLDAQVTVTDTPISLSLEGQFFATREGATCPW